MARISDDEAEYWERGFAERASGEAKNIAENPRSLIPNFSEVQNPTSGRDVLLSALMGFGKSMEASQRAAQGGDALTASLAAIAGAAGQPGPDMIAAQRQEVLRQRRLAQLEAMPVEKVSPGLAEKFPELKGVPLSIVQKLGPMLQRNEALERRLEMFMAGEQGKDRRAEVMAGRNEVKDQRATRTEEAKLRNELQQKSKDFVTIRDNYARISRVAKNPSPAGDLSLIFSYMKLLDPGSTVRESEFQNAEKAAPILTRYGLDFNKLGSVWAGKKLTDEQRADFIARSNDLYSAQKELHDQTRGEYRRLTEAAGGRPENVDVIGGVASSQVLRKMARPRGDTGPLRPYISTDGGSTWRPE